MIIELVLVLGTAVGRGHGLRIGGKNMRIEVVNMTALREPDRGFGERMDRKRNCGGRYRSNRWMMAAVGCSYWERRAGRMRKTVVRSKAVRWGSDSGSESGCEFVDSVVAGSRGLRYNRRCALSSRFEINVPVMN